MQSRVESIIESCVQTFSRMLMSFVIGYFVYPLFNYHPSFSQLTGLVVIFTISSLVQGYIWRRVFNYRLVRSQENG